PRTNPSAPIPLGKKNVHAGYYHHASKYDCNQPRGLLAIFQVPLSLFSLSLASYSALIFAAISSSSSRRYSGTQGLTLTHPRTRCFFAKRFCRACKFRSVFLFVILTPTRLLPDCFQ